jgi:capsule synthesis protein PGA_cap
MGGQDRSTVIGFALFWVVLGAGCGIGMLIVHAAGLGRDANPRVQAAPARSTPHGIIRKSPAPALSLQSIFTPGAPRLGGYDKRKLRTMIATGDVIPARSVNYMMVTRHDFLYPFRPTASFVRNADVTLINLESPLISSGCPVTVEGMSFCGDPRVVAGLTYAGVDVACTANNHIGNFGIPAIHETWQHLAAAGIQHCGLGDVAYHDVRGLRFAFLAYNAVGERFDYPTARREIREARKHADVVVVSVHWGKEYVSTPQIAPGIADDNPRQIAHWIIDSGADLVIGNHPHHVQSVELYHGHLITYAHGNFVFDQMFTTRDCPGDANYFCTTREGVVGKYTFYGKQLVAVRYTPVVIYNYAQPRWATPPQAKVILAGMKAASLQLTHIR